MRKRCYYPAAKNYERYGGRGITVCDEWRNNFSAFLSYMGPKPSPAHSIERIDNERGYEPSNVRWATAKEQAANRHNSGGRTEARSCAACGVEFAVHPYIVRRGEGKFCSVRCAAAARNTRLTVACPRCGAPVSRKKYDLDRHDGRAFCSVSHARLGAAESV